MATICPYKTTEPKRRCCDCPHCRPDEDGEHACWLAFDRKEQARMREKMKLKKEE